MTVILLAALLIPAAAVAESLPGTARIEEETDFAERMVEGIHRYLDRAAAIAAEKRHTLVRQTLTTDAAYENSVAANRTRFSRIIGLADQRVPFDSPEIDARAGGRSHIFVSPSYKVSAVRWPVLRGVEGQGLLLEPSGRTVAHVIALPDADWTPEMITGLAPGLPAEAQYARRLAEQGCLVLVPVLINRDDAWSANPAIGRFTNQPHREFIYRMAYEVGRHIIGYEVQKVLAAVDWFAKLQPAKPAGVVGYGEGGLIALYSAAVDTRIGTAAVSGYFGPRENLWREPIYRNVWGLLREFGDAEIAGLVAPRALIIESVPGPVVDGPPVARDRRRGAAPGVLVPFQQSDVAAEFHRALRQYERIATGKPPLLSLVPGASGKIGNDTTLAKFLESLGGRFNPSRSGVPPSFVRTGVDPAVRMHRQFDQLVEYTQSVVRDSESVRRKFWEKADSTSPESWQRSTEWYRRYFWEEVIGRLPDSPEPLVARTRLIYERPGWKGYEVVLPVWPDVISYGILLVPKNLKHGEKRPVIVCQHGLEGRPQDLIEPKTANAGNAYQRYAARLADLGYVVYAPQNPYLFEHRFREIQRKANPLKLSLFSFIAGQHQRATEWLSSLPFVDARRIGFYGLSYGGKTAMRVPALLGVYTFSICSGDFNEWIRKNTSVDEPFSYMYTGEYEMPEFDLGSTFNYAEMVNLIAPRPFMVERGHRDGVGVDEWVAYEYAKVRHLYADLGIPERTEIEFFNGPHQIHGVGTFRFLEKYLRGQN